MSRAACRSGVLRGLVENKLRQWKCSFASVVVPACYCSAGPLLPLSLLVLAGATAAPAATPSIRPWSFHRNILEFHFHARCRHHCVPLRSVRFFEVFAFVSLYCALSCFAIVGRVLCAIVCRFAAGRCSGCMMMFRGPLRGHSGSGSWHLLESSRSQDERSERM